MPMSSYSSPRSCRDRVIGRLVPLVIAVTARLFRSRCRVESTRVVLGIISITGLAATDDDGCPRRRCDDINDIPVYAEAGSSFPADGTGGGVHTETTVPYRKGPLPFDVESNSISPSFSPDAVNAYCVALLSIVASAMG
jgi:hypothetical protein